MKKIFLTFLPLCFSAAVYASPHETVCGGKALDATEALLRLNNKNIESVSQDSESMKLVESKHGKEQSFEKWDVTLLVMEKDAKSAYRSTVVRVFSKVDFGSDGSVVCTVREISTPFAD